MKEILSLRGGIVGKKKEALSVYEKANKPLAARLQKLVANTSELAAFLGCSVQAVNQYKQGTAVPHIEKIVKIAEFYNVSVDYLLGITDAPSRDNDIQSVCGFTGLSQKAVLLLHDLSSSSSYTKGFRESVISLILESDIFWNEIMEYVQNSYMQKKGSVMEISADMEREAQEAAELLTFLNFSGYTKYTVLDGGTNSEIQIQMASDSFGRLLSSIVNKILVDGDVNG